MILRIEPLICMLSHDENLAQLHQGSGLHIDPRMKEMYEASTGGWVRERL